MNAQCAWRVYEGYGARSCKHKPIISEDGRWWCAQHAPSKVKARQAAKEARWDAKDKAESAKYRLEAAAPDLLAALEGMESVLASAMLETARAPLHAFQGKIGVLDQARAAIAKAKGEQP